ncbi:GSCFA domain-containing protein [Flavobacterium sp.]|uniref:GSCFA domain-containing protein n=1 Tax=Flavobacterium sp. TaxID=239 RepID=UPI00352732FE
MNFRTEIPIAKYNFPIDYQSKIMLLGSCFSENIGEKFQYFKFQTTVNPFGIIFNPVSIEKLVKRVVAQQPFTENDIFYHNDLWHCFEVHSELSNPNKEAFLNNLNSIVESTHRQIVSLSHLLITLGTSWVYRNNSSKEIVANCHKVPQKEFTKELLSTSQIEESLQNIVSLIHSVNPNVKFIFTISPVRHIKDGFFENNVSKGNLLSALYKTVNCQLSTVNYFPSYEIMVDELRDYRFYKDDMLHPNQQAVDYIWIKFFENYINPNEFQLMNDICAIQKGLQHKPFNPDTEAHQKFLQNLQKKIETIKNQYPTIHF